MSSHLTSGRLSEVTLLSTGCDNDTLLLSAIVIVCMKYEIRQVMKSSISHLSSGDPFSETEKGFGVGPTPVGSQCTGVSLRLP